MGLFSIPIKEALPFLGGCVGALTTHSGYIQSASIVTRPVEILCLYAAMRFMRAARLNPSMASGSLTQEMPRTHWVYICGITGKVW